MKKSKLNVLTIGDGGLSDPTRKILPLQSLAQGETQAQSSALAQQGKTPPYTPPGSQQSKRGENSVLTGKSESLIPDSTLAQTFNWAFKELARRDLLEILAVREGGVLARYEIRLSPAVWLFANNALTLVSTRKDTE